MSGGLTNTIFFEHNPPPPPDSKPKKVTYKEQQKAALVPFKLEWEELWPLHAACRAGDLVAMRKYFSEVDPRLVKRKVSLQDSDQWTPLHYAAWYNNLEVCEALVELGADISALNVNKSTPLHYASAQGNVRVVKFLLSRNAAMQLKDIDGMTPLMLARSLKPDQLGEVERMFKLYDDSEIEEIEVMT